MTGAAPSPDRGLTRLSHGLRTPLAVIVGYAELLTLKRDETTLAEAPQRIKEAAEDLGRIVDDLLTVYALDAQVLYLAPVPTSIGPLVDGVVAEARERGTNVSVEAEGPSRDAEVLADPEYAQSMVGTLIENGRNRAANAGTTLRVRAESGFGQFEVSDLGGGLGDDERAVAFDAFSPLQPRTGLTTGLELYKVRRLSELQRGRVWIEDGPGGETRFGFALPLAS